MTYGTSTRHLEFQGITLAHKFVLADVSKPLLGADFFDAHSLCVDFEGRRILRLVDSRVVFSIPATLAAPDSSSFNNQVVKISGEYRDLLEEFPEVQQSRFGNYHNAHGVAHTVPTRGPPVFAKARRLCPERLACARQAFDKLLADGIIRSGDRTARGLPHFTWSPSPMGHGDPAVTFTV